MRSQDIPIEIASDDPQTSIQQNADRSDVEDTDGSVNIQTNEPELAARTSDADARVERIAMSRRPTHERQQPSLAEAPFSTSEANSSEGFHHLIGDDLSNWQGDLDGWNLEQDILRSTGKRGTIYTPEEYDDFTVRLEFKLPPGGNNGLAIHYPGQGDPAFSGFCEIQILDDAAEEYAGLDRRQYCGSAYALAAARRGHLQPTGAWNQLEVTVVGAHVTVRLNGNEVLDQDLSQVEHIMNNRTWRGRDRTSGHFGLFGHTGEVEFRNIQIKRLDPQSARSVGRADDPAADLDAGDPVPDEPPRLEQWLEGRKMLTVSQDGDADFTSIQAALDAMQAGEVVQVLDAGPYRENLRHENMPADTGLISMAQTVITARNRIDVKNGGVYAHWLKASANFRISGFCFTDHPENTKIEAQATMRLEVGAGAVTVEDCGWFSVPLARQHYLKGTLSLIGSEFSNQGQLTLRDCWVNGRVYCGGGNLQDELITRNVFGVYPSHGLVLIRSRGRSVVRQNVFCQSFQHESLESQTPSAGRHSLEFARNSFLRSTSWNCRHWTSGSEVSAIRNHFGVPMIFSSDAAQHKTAAAESWQRNGNIYRRPATGEQHLPLGNDEIVLGQLEFVDDMGDRNFGRILEVPDGISVDVLDNIGAVPPGPIPAEGDWLSRLRERWWPVVNAQISTLSEPAGKTFETADSER